MRSETEMYDLILSTARADERIRAVILNGSRANPNAPRDAWQDFDIIYIVTDVTPFHNNLEWLDRFGERAILQMPESMGDPPAAGHGGECYLTQFTDGNRIDLTLFTLADYLKQEPDSLTVVLLDKEGILPPIPPADESSYLPHPPGAKAYADCCNEFWWVTPYVAKGLRRGELPYARHMLEIVREQLTRMLIWQIGLQTDFAKNPGKHGKYFQRYLTAAEWDLLAQSYAGSGIPETWAALRALNDLFHHSAQIVAAHFGYQYPQGDEDGVRKLIS
ncbi:MAG TPA: aminoglycoside 6-adenylyltransferase [Anaerolineaceae bacterium]|nr:aminoglycoside 6-adenylyltransferase [Anaerolineaceae bacterium]